MGEGMFSTHEKNTANINVSPNDITSEDINELKAQILDMQMDNRSFLKKQSMY
ncbi:MAG: hypothetical protein ACLRR3_16925 [Eubacterium sp.]